MANLSLAPGEFEVRPKNGDELHTPVPKAQPTGTQTTSHLTDAYRQIFPKRKLMQIQILVRHQSLLMPPTTTETSPIEMTATEKKAMILALPSATPFKDAATAWKGRAQWSLFRPECRCLGIFQLDLELMPASVSLDSKT
jgi:hypothetical protein